jgi:hypothetical protein
MIADIDEAERARFDDEHEPVCLADSRRETASKNAMQLVHAERCGPLAVCKRVYRRGDGILKLWRRFKNTASRRSKRPVARTCLMQRALCA